MACEYCEKREKPVPLIYAGPEFGCLYIDGRCIVLDSFERHGFRRKKKVQVFPANFCPMCGSDLREVDR